MIDHTKNFWAFHRDNPDVYKTLVSMARDFRQRRPDQRIGIATLWESLRWDYWMNIKTDDEFKLSNTYRAFYARLIMLSNRDLNGMFEIKRSHADDDPLLGMLT